MSIILALDTSTDTCSVALNYQGEIDEIFSDIPREHTQRLLPMVDEILAKHQLSLQELDAIAFGRGPGSFTGLRICLSTVQGLSFAADIPLIGVSTLKTLAYSAARELKLTENHWMLVALDARMKQVYWGLYHGVENQLLAQSEERLSTPEELVDLVFAQNAQVEGQNADKNDRANLEIGKDSILGVGSGWCYETMPPLPSQYIYPDMQIHARDLAYIAQSDWQNGCAVTALEAQPVYLRNEISWQKRQRIR